MIKTKLEGWLSFLNKDGKLSENLYILFFLALFIPKMAGFYDGQKVFTLMLLLSCLFWMLKFMMTTYSVKEYVVCFGLLTLGFVIYLRTGEKGLLMCFAMMIGMKGVSTNRVITYGTICAIAIVFFKVFACIFGILPENYFASYRLGVGSELRHCLGYAHPNTVHITVLVLSFMFMYWVTRHTRNVLFFSLVILLTNIFTYMYSGSRTGLLVCIVYLIVNYWFSVIERLRLFEKIMVYAAYPVICIFGLLLPLMKEGRLYNLLNGHVFSYRLWIAKYYYDNNPFSLFGIRLNNPDSISYTIDMAYLYLLLQLGIAAFVTISVLTLVYAHKSIKLNKKAELAIFIAITFAGMWEPFLYNTSFKNIVFMFMGAVLFANKDEEIIAYKISIKHLLTGTLLFVICAFVGGAGFALVTDKPDTMYVNVEPADTEYDDVDDSVYFTPDEISKLKSNGTLVLGYKGESVPMYEFDQQTAIIEYNKKWLSIVMFAGYVAVFLYVIIRYTNKLLLKNSEV